MSSHGFTLRQAEASRLKSILASVLSVATLSAEQLLESNRARASFACVYINTKLYKNTVLVSDNFPPNLVLHQDSSVSVEASMASHTRRRYEQGSKEAR